MVQHSYLDQPGRWRARGRFWDRDGRAVQAEGWSEMRHEGAIWELVGELRLLGPEPVTFSSRYQIVAPSSPAQAIVWRSHNPALGEMTGIFCAVEDIILSSGASADGRHRVSECLIRHDAERYGSRGMLLQDDDVLSRWAMELTREGSPGTP